MSNSVCRVCLKTVNVLGDVNFINNCRRLKNMLLECAPKMNLEISDDPIICNTCNFLLEQTWTFTKTVSKTEELLNCYLNNNAELTTKISLCELKLTVNINKKDDEVADDIGYGTNEKSIYDFYCDIKDQKDSISIKSEILEDRGVNSGINNSEDEEKILFVNETKILDSASEYMLTNVPQYHVTIDDKEFVESDIKTYLGPVCDVHGECKIEFIEASDMAKVSKYNKRTYTCPNCEYKAERYGLLKKHTQDCKLKVDPKVFKCKFCSYTSKRKRNVVRHQYQHGGKKPYTCDLCKKDFVEKFILRDHIYRHMKKPPYTFKCSECEKEFMRKCDLNSHLILKHPEYRPFICKTCDKGFVDKRTCDIHTKTHLHSK